MIQHSESLAWVSRQMRAVQLPPMPVDAPPVAEMLAAVNAVLASRQAGARYPTAG